MMFDHLIAREVKRQEATPDTLYIIGYDDYIDSQVCWIVTNELSNQIKLRWNALQTTHAADDPRSMYRPSWLYGIARVGGEGVDRDLFDMERYVTAQQYAAIVAEARA